MSNFVYTWILVVHARHIRASWQSGACSLQLVRFKFYLFDIIFASSYSNSYNHRYHMRLYFNKVFKTHIQRNNWGSASMQERKKRSKKFFDLLLYCGIDMPWYGIHFENIDSKNFVFFQYTPFSLLFFLWFRHSLWCFMVFFKLCDCDNTTFCVQQSCNGCRFSFRILSCCVWNEWKNTNGRFQKPIM